MIGIYPSITDSTFNYFFMTVNEVCTGKLRTFLCLSDSELRKVLVFLYIRVLQSLKTVNSTEDIGE